MFHIIPCLPGNASVYFVIENLALGGRVSTTLNRSLIYGKREKVATYLPFAVFLDNVNCLIDFVSSAKVK
jgi:hypothetical protein